MRQCVAQVLRFGKNCKGNILHNYSPHDGWATVARGANLFATILGFPINFTGQKRVATTGSQCRDFEGTHIINVHIA